MNIYIATFYTHFGALSFFKQLQNLNIQSKLMPVPRKLSSSCGTCVQFHSENQIDFTPEDLECFYIKTEDDYTKLL